MTDYKFELNHGDAIDLYCLLENFLVGEQHYNLDEETRQEIGARIMSQLDEYLTRRRELIQDAHRDFWDF